MAARQERILTTEEIYGLVACLGVDGFNPSAKRDRNLVNCELSDLAGCTTQGHSRPSPQLIIRVSRGPYVYSEPDRPMDVGLSDDGEHEVRNLQLLCPYCNRVKGTQGSPGFRMKMTELRVHNVATGVMVDEWEADLTGWRGITARGAIRRTDGKGATASTGRGGACFGVPFQRSSLLEKRSVPIGPPLDRGQGDSEYAPAGPFRQVDLPWDDRPFAEGLAAVHGMFVVVEVIGPCIAQVCRAPVASDGVAGAKRGVVVAEACVRLRYE